jgi:hypothetical protein
VGHSEKVAAEERPGVGGQGRPHRKKVTIKKVHHAKAGRGGKTGPKV